MKLGGSCYISARSVQGHWASMQTKGCWSGIFCHLRKGKYEQTLSRSLMPMKERCLYDWYSYVRTWSQGGLFWRYPFSSLKWLFCLAYPWDSTSQHYSPTSLLLCVMVFMRKCLSSDIFVDALFLFLRWPTSSFSLCSL